MNPQESSSSTSTQTIDIGWLDPLLDAIVQSCYRSRYDRRWWQDKRALMLALTAPANIASGYNWALSEDEIRSIAADAVKSMIEFNEKLKTEGEAIKYPPAFLRSSIERLMGVRAESFKKASIHFKMEIADTEKIQAVHRELGEAAKRALKGRPRKTEIEQFELGF